jgi:WD40 repeat protein
VLTAPEDGTYRLWDLAENKMRLIPERNDVFSAAFDASGARIITATRDRSARIWALQGAGDPTLVAELTGHTDRVWSAAFSRDGGRVVTASRDRTARIWKPPWATPVAVLEGHGAEVLSAAFSPDGGRVVTASHDGTARVWSLGASGRVRTLGRSAPPILLGHDGKVNDAAFSANGAWVVTASDDRTVRIWSADRGILHLILRHGGPVLSAAFAPQPAGDRADPDYVATGAEDGTVCIWRVSPSALVEYAESASTGCLTADQRERYLAESEAQAGRRCAQCEQDYGRKP